MNVFIYNGILEENKPDLKIRRKKNHSSNVDNEILSKTERINCQIRFFKLIIVNLHFIL